MKDLRVSVYQEGFFESVKMREWCGWGGENGAFTDELSKRGTARYTSRHLRITLIAPFLCEIFQILRFGEVGGEGSPNS